MSMIATTCHSLDPLIWQCAVIHSMAYLPITNDRHHDLTLRIPIASDMTWKLLNIGHELGLLALSCCAANSSTECNRLAGYFALERT